MAKRRSAADRKAQVLQDRLAAAALSTLPLPETGDMVPVNAPPRPYSPQYAEQVRQAAAVGYTTTELCRLLGVGMDTLNLWRLCYAEFDAAVRTHTLARTERVEQAWFQRAVGYETTGEKVFCLSDGSIVRTSIVNHVPADTTAAMNWMKVHGGDKYMLVGDPPQSIEVNVSVTQVRATIEGKLARLAARLGEDGVPGQPDPAGDGGAGVELGLLGPS